MVTNAASFFLERFPPNKERIITALSNIKELQLIDSKGRVDSQRSNTTIFSFRYDKGAVIASDRRMSGDYFGISSDSVTKIKQLTPYSAMACSGFCAVIKYLVESMETACAKLYGNYGITISPDGQAHFLERLLEDWFWRVLITGYWAISRPILAAYDLEEKRTRVFSFDGDGFSYEPEIVAGAGCGFECINGLILDRWRPDLGRPAAIDLATRAMFFSGILSHGVSDARLSPPHIMTISEAGVVWLTPEEVTEHLNSILNENGGRKWRLT